MHLPEAEARAIIDAKIYKEISEEFDEEELNRIVRYSFEKGGKRCRAILLLLSTEASAGQKEKGLDAAAAIELIHTSSLIFDDIIDDETSRRKSKPLYLAFNRNAAITCGLFLASKAVQILSRYDNEDIVRVAAEAMVRASQGEMLDVLSRRAHDLDGYLEVASLKTGSLFAASAGIGGLLAGAPREHVETLSECGRLIGIAFQLRDDLLDLTQGAECRRSISKDITADAVSRLSLEYAEKAKAGLEREFSTKSNRLIEFADYVCQRLE